MPSITWWNRLEPRPRSADVAGALAARVRDPLFMLTRQWQFGEFHGEDAASPSWVELNTRVAPMVSWRAEGGQTRQLPANMPLEDLIESEAFTEDLSLRVELGQTFEALLTKYKESRQTLAMFRSIYPFPLATQQELSTATDREAAHFLRVCGGRAIDGVALYRAATLASPKAPPPVPELPTREREGAQKACADFVAWVREVFGALGTDEAAAWRSARLEYRAEVIANRPTGGEVVFTTGPAREAEFEWYAFDEAASTSAAASSVGAAFPVRRESMLPMHVKFRGSPNHRWWDFESGQTNFAAVQMDTRDVARLIVVDFMLVHGNDWFVAPFEQPIGTLCHVDDLVVHDVFGGLTVVPRADEGAVPGLERWTMFATTSAVNRRGLADYLVLPPTAAAAIQVGPAIEEARFLLDQMANMAWAVEHVTENRLGEPWSGHERDVAGSAREPGVPAAVPADGTPPIRYTMQTRVPENWIPLLPVAVDPQKGEIALKVGAMVRSTGTGYESIKPHGRVLKQGMLVEEQEVSRTGTRVTRAVCRSRWVDGGTHLWVARRKVPGSGEGSSGLRFDLAVPNVP